MNGTSGALGRVSDEAEDLAEKVLTDRVGELLDSINQEDLFALAGENSEAFADAAGKITTSWNYTNRLHLGELPRVLTVSQPPV